MIILLIALIFIVLFYFLNISSKESFSNTGNPNKPKTGNIDITLNYTLNNKIDGPVAYIKNINSFGNGFYEQMYHDNLDEDDCTNNEECGINGVCLERDGINRCNKIINKEAFKFIPNERSHIVIPNVNPNNLNLNFIILITNVNRTQPILSTTNGTWSLFIENGKFVMNIYKEKTVKKYFSDNLLNDNKIYEIILRVFDDVINISLDKKIITIPIENKKCFQDFDCGMNGFCQSSSVGDNYCSFTKSELILGKYNEEFFEGYIGDIYLNFDKNQDSILSCNFDSNVYKNRKICEEECQNDKMCDELSCNKICSNVQKCEFEPTGRHSEDCIQICRLNDDCDIEHCNEKCNKCGKSCPWNNLDENEKFDSDYYDKKGRPSPARISLINISSDGKKISLRWKPPYEGMADIEGYILYLYKTFNKSEGVKINNISTTNCSEYCNYILSDINPEETYTIGIKGFNSLGLGKMSNLLTFKPDKKSLNRDFNIVPNIKESIIGEFNYCNLDE